MSSELISTGPEWTFDLIQQYDKELARLADRFQLDTYPNQIEIISSEQNDGCLCIHRHAINV